MAVGEEQGALATAAVAVAAGAAVYGLRKALEKGGSDSGRSRDHDDGDSRASSVLETVWESASRTLLPLAEEAADAAGKWVAENAPDVLRDRIVPRFVEAFTDAA